MATADAFPADKAAQALTRLYRHAQRDLVHQVELALATGNLDRADQRRRQLAAVLHTLERLTVPLERDAVKVVKDAFDQSDERTVQRLERLGVGPVDASTFAAVNADAVRTMQDSILGRLTDARRTIGRQVDDVFAREGRKAVQRALLGVSGSPRAAALDLRRRLAAEGVTGFVDSAGRRWSLDRYAEMAVRTTTREAVVEASKLRMAAHGVNLARVSSHASSCTICLPWERRVVSLDGTISELDGEPVATLDALPNGGPPFHPNCRHTLSPVVPAIDALHQRLAGAAA